MTSINFKVIGLTQPGFEPARSKLETCEVWIHWSSSMGDEHFTHSVTPFGHVSLDMCRSRVRVINLSRGAWEGVNVWVSVDVWLCVCVCCSYVWIRAIRVALGGWITAPTEWTAILVTFSTLLDTCLCAPLPGDTARPHIESQRRALTSSGHTGLLSPTPLIYLACCLHTHVTYIYIYI